MRRRRLALILVSAAAGAIPASGQTRAREGAVWGGVAGAVATGAFGGLLSRAVCDAADCSDAWLDGAVPGAVIGGLAGAVLGAGVGSLIKARTGSAEGAPAGRGFGVLVEGSTARAEWNELEETVYGLRGMAGLRQGGLLVGPTAEWLSGGGWRTSSVGLAARLDPARGAIRPFAELSAGRYGWSNPAILAHCDPAPPDCTFSPGTMTDHYLGAAGAVGLSAGDRAGRWRVFATVRFHYRGGRPTGDPTSTASRELRQLAVGGEIRLGARSGSAPARAGERDRGGSR